MWYFSWILGLGFALTVAIINAIWLESNYAFGQRTEDTTVARFRDARKQRQQRKA
ncbi:cytochrome bd-I oxidase subunit CydX [Massilia sp. YIM B02763]|uniref:cytochrome bd-I oxidase subunit CydX n=1 Tax=Massilia sp. YIM B02763 TaxID=3050130 RepID=UPI0025B65CEE|nr:cytochrome bd-I oxidase subunit CydX [Massilia sp. YIM B02763]MDN4053717.1 cytochrome bd-I oxidase subunit CydX [Massilia sp. YIM B02763]